MTCPLCNGSAAYLGTLGHLDHFRCQQCGMDFHREAGSCDLDDDYGDSGDIAEFNFNHGY